MTFLSSLRARRSIAQNAEVEQQVLTFHLRQELFAVPIHAVEKVTTLGRVYGDPQGNGISLTVYEGQELLVVDVGRRIFGDRPTADLSAALNADGLGAQKFLVVLEIDSQEFVGLPIDSLPVVRQVPQSAFKPLPSAYVRGGNIRCVSSLMLETEGQPPLFLLDIKLLSQPEKIVASD